MNDYIILIEFQCALSNGRDIKDHIERTNMSEANIDHIYEATDGKYSRDYIRDRLNAIEEKFADIDVDTIVDIMTIVLTDDDTEIDLSRRRHEKYLDNDLTVIKQKVKDNSDPPGICITSDVIKHYIDNVMNLDPDNKIDTSYPADNDQYIAALFTINTDGWQCNDHHDIDDINKLIETQSPELLLQIISRSNSSMSIAYYIGPQTPAIIDAVINAMYVDNYRFVINQTDELNQHFYNKASAPRAYASTANGSYYFNGIFSQMRKKSIQMCDGALKLDPYNIGRIPRLQRSVEMLRFSAINMPPSSFRRYVDDDALTEQICVCIAQSTVCNEKFANKLELIPEKFRTIKVYAGLMKEHCNNEISFKKHIAMVPKPMQYRIVKHLIANTDIKKVITDLDATSFQ